jgi:TRAP-type C4-dicarboxylate transport system permease small subunit
MMQVRSGTLIEWLVPLAFILCAGWVVWHLPAFTLDLFPPEDPSAFDKLSALFKAKDVSSGLSGLFGGFADIIDWLALIGIPLTAYVGVRTVRRAGMEFESWKPADRLAVFVGRVTMMLVVVLTCVMLRYVFEAPTLWANEMSLWLAGFVFLCSGLYAMQQRSHIRIVLLYDAVPRSVQRIFDSISTLLIVVFAFFLCYGGYGEAFEKLYRWETFGTAFDPPIPATMKPMVLIIVSLVAVQAVVNLISDWGKDEVYYGGEDLDEEEIERIKAQVAGN